MRKRALLASIAGAALVASAYAQMPMDEEGMAGMGAGGMGGGGCPMMQSRGGGGMSGMMGGGMMSGMMGGGGGMGMGQSMSLLGLGSMAQLDLSREQQAKMDKIEAGLRQQNWTLMGKMMDARSDLRALHRQPAPDAEAVGKAYDRVFGLQRQMIVNRVAAKNQAQALLTPEQRAQLKQRRGMGMGMMGMCAAPARQGQGAAAPSGPMSPLGPQAR